MVRQRLNNGSVLALRVERGNAGERQSSNTLVTTFLGGLNNVFIHTANRHVMRGNLAEMDGVAVDLAVATGAISVGSSERLICLLRGVRLLRAVSARVNDKVT